VKAKIEKQKIDTWIDLELSSLDLENLRKGKVLKVKAKNPNVKMVISCEEGSY
jgi:hypothetical protein